MWTVFFFFVLVCIFADNLTFFNFFSCCLAELLLFLKFKALCTWMYFSVLDRPIDFLDYFMDCLHVYPSADDNAFKDLLWIKEK